MPFSDHPFDLGCSPTWTPRTSRTRGDQNVMENRLCLPALILCGGLLVACRAGPAPVPELGPRPPVALVDAAADAEGGAPPPVTQLPAVDVWTQHNDNARTGANLREVALSPASVTSGRFRRLFEWPVHGQQYAQPLYLSDVSYHGRVIDMAIVATMENFVEAFEVPAFRQPPSKTALWTVDSGKIGAPLRFTFAKMGLGPTLLGHNIRPWIGITSTPVVDRDLGLIYVCAKARHHETGRPTHYLAAIDFEGRLQQSTEIPQGVPDDFAMHQLQRPALLEANGQIYVAFGPHEDHPPYQGRVYAYDRKKLRQTGEFSALPPGASGGGIWQAGAGLASDSAGNVYAISSNTVGAGNAQDGVGQDAASSFLRLAPKPGPKLELAGSWTPANWRCQDKTDADLGSAGPLFDPSTGTLVGGGKEGILYALRPEALTGRHAGDDTSRAASKPCEGSRVPAQAGNGYTSIQASPIFEPNWKMDLIRWFDPAGQMMGYHHIHGSPALWRVDGEPNARLYLSAERDRLRAFELAADGKLQGSAPGVPPVSRDQSLCANSEHGMPGGFMSLSANGGDHSSGIVWVSMPRWNHDALHHVAPGVLRAYRAYPDGDDHQLTELWNSERGLDVARAPQDCSVGLGTHHERTFQFAKFASPTVARGRVYLPTFSNELIVYGLADDTLSIMGVGGAGGELDANVASTPVAPGALVTVNVVAKNVGSKAWRQGDQWRIACGQLEADSEGEPSVASGSDVPAGASFGGAVTIVAPDDEGTHYLRCALVHEGGAEPTASQDNGTAEVSFEVLRPECADLRKRRDDILSKFTPDGGLPMSLKPDTERLESDAEKRGCYLGGGHLDHAP